jgi:hypothetical protein
VPASGFFVSAAETIGASLSRPKPVRTRFAQLSWSELHPGHDSVPSSSHYGSRNNSCKKFGVRPSNSGRAGHVRIWTGAPSPWWHSSPSSCTIAAATFRTIIIIIVFIQSIVVTTMFRPHGSRRKLARRRVRIPVRRRRRYTGWWDAHNRIRIQSLLTSNHFFLRLP